MLLLQDHQQSLLIFIDIYHEKGPEAATDYFYNLAKDSHYIRTDRVAKNEHWFSSTPYGDLELTINLSKPEKDPVAIAAEKNNVTVSYPDCLLCKENVGYAGRIDHPARQNHRIIPVELDGKQWCLQFSPYVYYNEHSSAAAPDCSEPSAPRRNPACRRRTRRGRLPGFGAPHP